MKMWKTVLPNGGRESALRIFQIGACWLFCSLLLGCIVAPVPARRHTIGAGGPTPENKKIDLSFVRAGSTRREEVVQNLGWIDTGLNDKQLFLGRWVSSSSAIVWLVGGEYSAAAGGYRMWGAHNLMIEFDAEGVVEQYHVINDQDLIKGLSAWAEHAQLPMLNLSAPVEMPILTTDRHLALHRPGAKASKKEKKPTEVALVTGSLQFRGPGKTFGVSPAKITHVTSAHWFPHEDAVHTIQTIHFCEKTEAGRKVVVEIDLPTLVALLRFIRQSQQSTQ